MKFTAIVHRPSPPPHTHPPKYPSPFMLKAFLICLGVVDCSLVLKGRHSVHRAASGLQRRRLRQETPPSAHTCLFSVWLCISSRRNAAAPILDLCSKDEGDSRNLMVSGSLLAGLGGRCCPSVRDSGLLLSGNELPFCSLTGQVGEVYPGVCFPYMFLFRFTPASHHACGSSLSFYGV